MELADEGATFCVRCGSTTPPFIGAECVPCFSRNTPLASLPPYVDVVLCSTCGSRQVGNHWEKARGPNPEEVRRSDLDPQVRVSPPGRLLRATWEVSGQNPRLRQVEAKLLVEVEGSQIEVPARTEVHIILHSCPDCSRRGGHYFTSRIQIRSAEEGSPRALKEFKPWALQIWHSHLKACSEVQREAVSREEELKEGWDIFFSDTAAARAVARSFKARSSAQVKESASLWGVKNGREVHRVTFLMRLPPVGIGDHLEQGGRLWEVFSLGEKGGVEMRDVQDGAQRRVENEEVARMRLVSGPEGRTSLALLRPPRGPPFVRDPTSGDQLPLYGDLPPVPAEAGEPPAGETVTEPTLPFILGKREAWWAPRGGRPARNARHQSKR